MDGFGVFSISKGWRGSHYFFKSFFEVCLCIVHTASFNFSGWQPPDSRDSQNSGMKSFRNFWHQTRLLTEQICPATLDLQGFVPPEAALPAFSRWQDVFRGDWECKSWMPVIAWVWGKTSGRSWKTLEDHLWPPFFGSKSISLGFLSICLESCQT